MVVASSSALSGVDRVRRVPEGAEHRHPAAVVPRAGRDLAARLDDALHLPHAAFGVGHEVDDELREGGVERIVLERQLLGRGDADVRGRQPRAAGRDEGSGRVDGGDVLGADDLGERVA